MYNYVFFLLHAGYIDQVLASDADIEEIAAVWVGQYRKDKANALRSLVNFIIRVKMK